MEKISLFDFKQMMDCPIKENRACVEIHFCVDGNAQYPSCWLGKLISKENEEVYWLGLTEDGTEAYDFASKEQLLSAKVFCGKGLQDIWKAITIISIDACEPHDRLLYYKDNG